MESAGFGSDTVRSAFDSSARDFAVVVRQLTDGGVDWETELPSQWKLRTVIGHTSRALSTTMSYLEQGQGGTVEITHPFDYFRGINTSYSNVSAIVERAEAAGHRLGPDPAAVVSGLATEAAEVVGAADDAAPVVTPAGVMSLLAYLPSRVFVLATDTADLAATFGLDYEPSEEAANLALMMSVGIAVEAADAVDALTVLVASTPRVLLPTDDDRTNAHSRRSVKDRLFKKSRSTN